MSAFPAKKTQSSVEIGESAQKLTSKPVTLTMRQAELKAVLRSMARAVNYNLLVKNDLKGEVSVDFRGVPWDQAFTGLLKTHGLSYAWEGSVIRVMTIEDMEQELKRKVQMRDIQWVEPLMSPVVIKIDYADAKKLEKTLQDFLTKDKDGKARGSVVLDDHSNSLVISATSLDLAKMIPIIEKLDKSTPQINIKAHIVETSKNVARDLGIMWGGMYKGNLGNKNIYVTPGGSMGTAKADPLAGEYTPATGLSGIAGQGFAGNFPVSDVLKAVGYGSLGLIYGVIGESLLELQLQALQQNNKLHILSSPSITTLDNQLAFTENGEKVPFITLTSSAGSAPTQTTNFVDVMMRLEITPHVIDGKNLKMEINVKKEEVDISRKSALGDPYIVKKHTKTSLIVKDGETIVISGLTKQTIVNSDRGWPWLKDIPVLGYLFKAENKNDAMEEVLIFITPTILKTDEESPQASLVLPEGSQTAQAAEK